MNYRLEDLIDIPLLQELQDKLDRINSFPSALIDNDGKILTATSWQDICTKFHRINPESEKECIISDKYINEHIHEANPAVSYICPHGMVDSATPIIIGGKHLGNFFTGQFFHEKPDLEFFRKQARKYNFDEKAYLDAVAQVPIWSKEQSGLYIDFIKTFIDELANIGLTRIKEAEVNDVIKESEERFHNILLTAMDGFWIVGKNGEIIDVNDSACNMLGYTREELLQLKIFDIESAEMPNQITEHTQRIINNETDRFETKHRCKDGSIIDVEISITWRATEMVFYCFMRDITKRKSADAALEEESIRRKILFEQSPDGILIIDPQTAHFLEFNTAAHQQLGYSREEFTQLSIFDVEAKENAEETKAKIAGVIKNGRADFESLQRTKHGNIRNIYVTAQIVDVRGQKVYHCIWRDITERKQVEAKLFESQMKLEDAQEVAKIGFWNLNLINMDLEWTKGLKSIFEIPQDDPTPTYDEFWNYVFKEDRDFVEEQTKKQFTKMSEPSITYIYRIRTKKGNIKYLEHIGRQITNAENRLIGIYGSIQNVTERKRTEIELEKHRNHLEELVKIRTEEIDAINKDLLIEIEKKIRTEQLLQESLEKEKELSLLKSRFISTASHEFRTPLTTVLSSVELLEHYGDKLGKDSNIVHMERIKSSVKYLTKLMDDVLNVSRADAGKIPFNRLPINLKLLCRRAIEESKPAASCKHDLVLNYLAEKEIFELDTRQMNTVLANLLSNAIKYSPNGGLIELKVTFENENIFITVSDNGIGIPNEDIEQLFEPFHRGTNATDIRGTGLGLTIVKNAVDLHKGNIRVNSKPGKGTTFYITIPILR
jgi:PAS domain S-box-containing protein